MNERDPLFTLDELAATAARVSAFVPPTPAYAWPLLANQIGVEVVVKHENHTPTGSFKARGGLIYVDALSVPAAGRGWSRPPRQPWPISLPLPPRATAFPR